MPAAFHVTYDKYTPASVDRGEPAESGFVTPGGWHTPLEPGVFGEAAGEVKRESALRLREALDLVGCFDTGSDGFAYYEADSREDYATGEHERRAFHLPHNATAASVARVSRLLALRRLISAREAC